jgi:hypothetical protein
MTDYLPLLSRAVANLENPEARRRVYDRARQALLAQLRAMNPPLAEAEITRERLALEEAIRRLDQQAAAKAEPAAPSPPPAAGAPPSAPQPRTAPSPRPPAPSPRPPAAAPGAPSAPPPVPSRERLAAEPSSGSKVVRDALEGVRPLGPAASGAARSARGVAGETGDLPEPPITPGVDPRARFGRDDEGPSVNDLAGRGGRRGTIDYAKADARKAMKAKLVVGGIVCALLAVAILIGYVQRDRILSSLGIGSPPSRSAQQSSVPAQDRITQSPQTKSGAQTNVPAAAVAQRAVLYEENPGGSNEQQLQTFVGTAVWRTETVNPGPGRPPELGLRVDIEIPDRKMTVTISMRRNPDQTLPASHTVEVQFKTPGDPFGGVANLPGIRAKTTETAQGAPLVGLVVRVMPGFFLIGLSNVDADREQNLSLLRERGWLDIPFVYNNGRRSVLVVEKGTPGERAVNEVVAAWGG